VPELLTFVLFFFQNSGVASQLQIFFSDFANGILLIKGLQKKNKVQEYKFMRVEKNQYTRSMLTFIIVPIS
jgi:hypothetical protein